MLCGMQDKMSTTSSEVYAARIHTPVHISLTGQSFTSRMPTRVQSTTDEASTTFSRCESSSAIYPTVRHGSLTVIVHPPVSPASNGGESSTSKTAVGRDRHRWSEDLGLNPANLNTGVFVNAARRRRDAPLPPRLPAYTETEPPPPYNPDYLVPMSCHRWLDAEGRRWSSVSACCRPPPPPSRRSLSTAKARSRSSLPLVSGRCLMDNNDNNDEDNDDVFFAEKPTMLAHRPEKRSWTWCVVDMRVGKANHWRRCTRAFWRLCFVSVGDIEIFDEKLRRDAYKLDFIVVHIGSCRYVSTPVISEQRFIEERL